MIVLGREAVRAALDMATCIAVVEAALRAQAEGRVQPFPRVQLAAREGGGLLGLMPVRQSGPEAMWCVKLVIVAPGNRARGLDSHQGAILLHDGETGELAALVDADEITALRTAAASAVATRHLARPDACRVAILGTGRQARSHAEAMRLVLPGARLVLWGRDRDAAGALAAELGAEAAATAEAAVVGADVVCTVTASRTPILERAWLRPGCHVNAVGASSPTARELATDVMAMANVFFDSAAQAQTECGEYRLAVDEGGWPAERPLVELGAVLAGQTPGRPGPEAITVFKSLGVAVEDLAAARAAVAGAMAAGRAVCVPW